MRFLTFGQTRCHNYESQNKADPPLLVSFRLIHGAAAAHRARRSGAHTRALSGAHPRTTQVREAAARQLRQLQEDQSEPRGRAAEFAARPIRARRSGTRTCEPPPLEAATHQTEERPAGNRTARASSTHPTSPARPPTERRCPAG